MILGIHYSFVSAAGVLGQVSIQSQTIIHDILMVPAASFPMVSQSAGGAVSFPDEQAIAVGIGSPSCSHSAAVSGREVGSGGGFVRLDHWHSCCDREMFVVRWASPILGN